MAEAGYLPGVVYYLSRWFPASYRARAMAAILIGIPLSQAVGGLLGSALLNLSGIALLAGWQWLFLIEGLPTLLLGVAVLRYLTEHPQDARWLSGAQRVWLSNRLAEEQHQSPLGQISALRALANPLVWGLTVPYFAVNTVALGFSLWAPILVRDALGTSNTIDRL